MLVVVDTNIIFSALVTAGKNMELLFREEIQPICPEFLFSEIEEHMPELSKKSGLVEKELDLVLALLEQRVRVISLFEFEGFVPKANELSSDPDDAEFIALALKFKAPLWSNDKALKRQSEVLILSTDELISLLNP